MFTRCICISPCRYKNYEFRIGELYSYKEVINYKNELTEYALFNYNKDTNRSTSSDFIGYLKINFKRSNFMNFGSYIMLMNEVDKMYERILWDI